MTKQVIREYDWVEIVDPRFFIRCGYPLDPNTEQARISVEREEEIDRLLFSVLGWEYPRDKYRRTLAYYERAYKAVAAGLAFGYVKAKGMGGRERALHLTEPKPEVIGMRFQVLGKKYVKTGRYFPPSGSEDEYDPGGLTDPLTHVILRLGGRSGPDGRYYFPPSWIPQAHCNKVKNPHERD